MAGPTPIEDPSDSRLSRTVMDALWQSEPIRALDLRSLRVEARGGVVALRGIVASDAHKVAAGQLARRVPGVKDVVNELLTDELLEGRIALTLASAGATRKLRIAVNVVAGVAGLYGAVASGDDAEAARAIALGVQGVVGVESRLKIVPANTPVVLAWQDSLEGRPAPAPKPPADETAAPTGPSSPAPPTKAAPPTPRAEGAA